MEDCVVCGEAVSIECKGYKCGHGHEYHRLCFKSSTKKKLCLVCEEPVKLPYAARAKRSISRKPRAYYCKGKTATGKKCRNRTFMPFCHLHTPVPTEAEAADTIEL